jgi:hypothetical protein
VDSIEYSSRSMRSRTCAMTLKVFVGAYNVRNMRSLMSVYVIMTGIFVSGSTKLIGSFFRLIKIFFSRSSISVTVSLGRHRAHFASAL